MTSTTQNKKFPQRLKELRMQKGISQKEFAHITNLNYAQYNRYEMGDRMPSTDTISKLADALGVSVDYLLEGDTENATFVNLEDKELLKMFEEVEKLPLEKKNAIKIILESVVKENKHQQLAS
jgi:transcriptional regulator with XRE-family HTH domain